MVRRPTEESPVHTNFSCRLFPRPGYMRRPLHEQFVWPLGVADLRSLWDSATWQFREAKPSESDSAPFTIAGFPDVLPRLSVTSRPNQPEGRPRSSAYSGELPRRGRKGHDGRLVSSNSRSPAVCCRRHFSGRRADAVALGCEPWGSSSSVHPNMALASRLAGVGSTAKEASPCQCDA